MLNFCKSFIRMNVEELTVANVISWREGKGGREKHGFSEVRPKLDQVTF